MTSQSFNELFHNIQLPVGSQRPDEFELQVFGGENKKWILTRKYLAGSEDRFDCDCYQQGVDFVHDRIQEMRYLLNALHWKNGELQVNPLVNSNGERIWNVSLPVAGMYSVTVNLICIFRLREV